MVLRAFAVLALTASWAAGCGPSAVFREAELEIVGLSGRAVRLVVQVVPGSRNLHCAEITPGTVQGLEPLHRFTWERSGGAPRQFALPEIDEERVTLVAHAEDEAGRPIQLGCLMLEYAALESPEIVLELSARAGLQPIPSRPLAAGPATLGPEPRLC